MGTILGATPLVPEGSVMTMQDGDALSNPRLLGSRLQDARRTRKLTQETVAADLDLSRTTIVAIEKGERRVTASELIAFANLYGRSVSELVGRQTVTEPFVAQFRTMHREPIGDEESTNALQEATKRLQSHAERYVELERITGVPLAKKYPSPYDMSGPAAETAGEDLATSERHRLGLGDGPVTQLRERLESDVGVRTFVVDMSSTIAGLFAYNDDLGACIAINSKHPYPRQRWTLAHEYAHFLTNRYEVEVTWLAEAKRVSPRERLADSFAQRFLMPASGLNRRFSDTLRGRKGNVTLADICSLADLYEVSVQAIVRALEALGRVPRGLWDRLEQQGFRPGQAQAMLGLTTHSRNEDKFPRRYELLAVHAYENGRVTEGQLMEYLELDRLSTRQRVQTVLQSLSSERGDELGDLRIDALEPIEGK